jgi:dGTPase
MRKFGGFEGNAQTLRLLTETIFSDEGKRSGMNPTRALIDGVMKYKKLFRDRMKEKHFIYDEQERFLSFVNGTADADEQKSIECQIMDWADDTAYSIGDLIDGIRAKFITPFTIERWAADSPLVADQENAKSVEELIEAIRKRNISRFAALRIGDFIEAAALEERPGKLAHLTNRHRFSLTKKKLREKQYELYNRLAVNIVFTNPQVHQLEFKGNQILQRLFESLIATYVEHDGDERDRLKLVPAETERNILEISANDRTTRARLLCDHIAGMSDDFAIRTYRRLFDADFGSIVDLV